MPLRSTPSRSYFLALTLAVALLASGCTTETPVPTPTAATTAPPIFASEDEALAAAEEIYARYSIASNLVLQEKGDKGPESLARYLHQELLEDVVDEFRQYRKDGIYSKGDIRYDSMRLQSYSDDGVHEAEIVVYLCIDVSKAFLYDEHGKNVTPPGRPDRVPVVLEFQTVDRTQDLLITSSEGWTGDNFCAPQ